MYLKKRGRKEKKRKEERTDKKEYGYFFFVVILLSMQYPSCWPLTTTRGTESQSAGTGTTARAIDRFCISAVVIRKALCQERTIW